MKTIISPCFSVSGFACNGKSTFIQKCIVQGWYVFEEPVKTVLSSLKFTCKDLDINQYPQVCQGAILGCSLYSLFELMKMKFHFDFRGLIVGDRNIFDVLTFSILKGILTEKECKDFLESLLEEINKSWTIVDDIVIPVYDSIYHIQTCVEKDFIQNNCLTNIRQETITSDVDYFISLGIEFDEIFTSLVEYIQEYQNSNDYPIILVDKYQFLKQLPNEDYATFLQRIQSYMIQDIKKIEKYFKHELKKHFGAES